MFCWHLMAFGAANLGGQCRWMHKMAAPTRVQMREALLPRQAEMARDDHGREYLSRISPPKKRWEDDLKPPLWWDMFDMLVGTVFVLHVRNDKQTKNDTLGELSQSCEFFSGSPQKDQKSSGKMPPSSPILDYFILGRPIFKGEVLGLGRVVAPSLCQRTSGQVHQMSWHIFHMDSKGDAPTPRIKISLFTVTGWGGVLMDNPKMAQQMSERHRMSTLWSCALLASFEP